MRSLFLYILLFSVIALTGFGCLDDMEEVPLDQGIDVLDAPEGIEADVSDGSVFLSWSAVDGAVSYNVYRKTSSTTGFPLISSSTGITYLDDEVRNGQQYIYSVGGVNARGLEGRRTEEILAVPSVYSISIDGGSEVVNSRIVDLTITAPISTVLMKISNGPEMSGVDWEVFSDGREWDIGAGDGEKHIYAQFQDENGSRSNIISKAVELDTYSSITSVSISPDLMKYTIGATVHFEIIVDGDETEGTAWLEIENLSEEIALYDDGRGGDQVASDGVYEASFNFPGSYRGTDLGIAGMFVDRAGNQAPTFEAGKKISFTDPPDPVQLICAMDSTTSSITIKWVESTEPDFLAYRIYRSTTEGVPESPEYFVRGLDNRSQTTYPDGDLIEGVVYYYRIFVVNDLLDTAGSNELVAHTYDVYPAAVILDPPSAVGTDRLTLTWSVNEDTDFEEYRIYRSTSPGVTTSSLRLPYISDREITWFDDTGLDLTTNTYYYRVIVFDKSGKSARSNEISTE